MAKKKRITQAEVELYEKVRELHDGGLSFAAIGRELGFTKQYAHHILRKGRPDPEAVQPVVNGCAQPSNGLTVRERLFLRGLTEGKSQRQAALDAVEPGQITPESASQWANKKLKNRRVLTAFQELLEQHGLTEERLIQTHVENLHAMKVVATATENGKVTDIVERPDFRARQAAVRDAWRLWNRLEKHAQEEPPPPRTNMILSLSRVEWINKVLNRPLEQLLSGIQITDSTDDDAAQPAAPDPAPKPDAPSADGAPPSTADDVEWEDDDDITIDL